MTKFTQLLIGTGIATAIATGVALRSQGTVEISTSPEGVVGQLNFIDNDVSLTATGRELLHILNAPCTGSGQDSINGVPGAYGFCNIPLPPVISSSSGVLLGTSLECGNFPLTGRYDAYFSKYNNDVSASGTYTIGTNIALLGTGSVTQFNTGAIVWNGADFLKIITKQLSGGAGQAFGNSVTDCRVVGGIRDFYGE